MFYTILNQDETYLFNRLSKNIDKNNLIYLFCYSAFRNNCQVMGQQYFLMR